MVGWLIGCGLIGYRIITVRSFPFNEAIDKPSLVRVVTADHLDEADADAEELPPPPVAAASMPSGLKEMPALRSTTPPVMDASSEAMKRSVTRVRLTTWVRSMASKLCSVYSCSFSVFFSSSSWWCSNSCFSGESSSRK